MPTVKNDTQAVDEEEENRETLKTKTKKNDRQPAPATI